MFFFRLILDPVTSFQPNNSKDQNAYGMHGVNSSIESSEGLRSEMSISATFSSFLANLTCCLGTSSYSENGENPN